MRRENQDLKKKLKKLQTECDVYRRAVQAWSMRDFTEEEAKESIKEIERGKFGSLTELIHRLAPRRKRR